MPVVGGGGGVHSLNSGPPTFWKDHGSIYLAAASARLSRVLRSGPEISSSSGDRPNISGQQITTLAGVNTNRISIDNVTNPTDTFICKFVGCNAAPFRTQYLLDSHANVHSSAWPHYCPVKGCPRSEGGKGFKRKNEMIRHGLVHETPGYR
ncbi:krueppel-like factor 11 [Apiospora phragmitis]|uniref:Krueppel-like factor 11 n=1 Tax=Apiospora phragmitis TaxID=2905665 RepID=A0ABR1SR92_9PEZI